MPLLYYRHGRLGHALVRDFDYFGWIHINREGFRGPEVAMLKAPDIVRIMAVGSSTTFDPSVNGDEAAWPARLQFWLTQLAPEHAVEVINAGVPGYRVIDDLIRLETELFEYRPDVAILYEGHNDLFSALRRGREPPVSFTNTPGEIPALTPWGHWLSGHSLLYGKLVARLQTLRFRAAGRRALEAPPAPERSPEAVIDSGARRFEQDLTAFLAVARTLGIRVVIPEVVQVSGVGALQENDPAVHEMWAHTVPFGRPEDVLLGYVRFNAVLQRVAVRSCATWVSTKPFGLVGTAWYESGDPVHFNDRGADRMAHGLAEALLRSGVLESATAGGSGATAERTSSCAAARGQGARHGRALTTEVGSSRGHPQVAR